MIKFLINSECFKVFTILILCLLKSQNVLSACPDDEWDCDDGDCIPSEKLCNGVVDCKDGSDEIAENCIHLYRDCEKTGVPCTYGACMTKSDLCNGIQDCADDSDELICPIIWKKNLQGRCGENELQCLRSKECIHKALTCDGHKDCIDGTDEKVEVCAEHICPEVKFHCGYGGCIELNARCNGTIECIDGSDEAWQLCGTPRKSLSSIKEPELRLLPPKMTTRNDPVLTLLSPCPDGEWDCDDGDCIPLQKRCNGIVDCKDRSDEIAENCIHLYRDCEKTGVPCTYGACITKGDLCNGIQDCSDHSDELTCPIIWKKHLQGRCGENELQCLRSKECIAKELTCDGHKDCTDGTDETVEVCAEHICPELKFHCGYGGCIELNARCNGTIECIDGSDEAWQLCGTPRKSLRNMEEPEKNCRIPLDYTDLTFMRHPDNKTLLPGTLVMDSDSIYFVCKNRAVFEGPNFAFCIYGEWYRVFMGNGTKFPPCDLAYCDGTLLQDPSTSYSCYRNGRPVLPRNCNTTIAPYIDIEITCATGYKTSEGNDGQRIRCLPNGQFDVKLDKCQPTFVVQPKSTTALQPINGGMTCQIPDGSVALVITLLHSDVQLAPGSVVSDYETVQAKCANKNDEPIDLLCIRGKWQGRFPTCKVYCDNSFLRGISTSYVCHQNGVHDGAWCNPSILPNTIIDVFCATGYQRIPSKSQQLQCLQDGKLSEKRLPCEQHCGQLTPAHSSLTKNAFPIIPSDAPWHVAIFENFNGEQKHICGGSIISPRLVISAAHCFWNNTVPKSPHLYRVIAGKQNNNYYQHSVNDGFLQDIEVEKIHMSDIYGDRLKHFYADIALLKLKTPVMYNDNVSSLCMYIPEGDTRDYVYSDIIGSISGYGRSGTLERLSMATLSHEWCKNLKNISTLAFDKFCLRNENVNTTLCRGDSGGGFVVQSGGAFYLMGIVSYTPETRVDCVTSDFVVMSNVRQMRPDLKEIWLHEIKTDQELF